MAGYSNLLSSFGSQAPQFPTVPGIGGFDFGTGGIGEMGAFAPVAGATGGSLSDQLAMFNQNAGKLGTKDLINTGLTGVQTIGGLIGALGSLSMAKKQFSLQKRMSETNLANSVGAYNTALDDKARSRAVVEGQSDADRDAYIERNRARG